MKRYIKATTEDSEADNDIVNILIDAIERGQMRYYTEWNAFCFLSGYFRGEPQDLNAVFHSIRYVFNNRDNIKNGEFLDALY